MTITWLPAPGVLQRQPTAAQGSECCDQGRPHVPAQDRSPLQWTGAVVTTAYLPTKTLHDVVPQVRPRFEELLAHATSLGLKPSIRSAGRTCEEQAEQVKGGYSHADFCRSMHVLGHAVDLDLSPNTCESHTKLGAWWESRGGVWGGRWKQFGACGDMGHYHYGFGGAGAVPTATCPSGVTLEQCQKLREEYLDRAYAAGPGVSSKSGLWAGLAIAAAGAAFVWAALSVKPGRLAVVRGNPRYKYDAWEVTVYLPGGKEESWGPATWEAAMEVGRRFRFQTRELCPGGCNTSVHRVAGKPKYEFVNGELRKIARRAA